MEDIRQRLIELLEEENKEACYKYIIEKIQLGQIGIVDLYENIFTPVLNQWQCKLEDKNICIWKEHVRTAIVRTIVESCYPFVIQERDAQSTIQNKSAVVICPPEEYHDLGARMVSDFMTILGYESVFVGQNTPYGDFYNAIHAVRPKIIAISVSNYYNLVATKKIIEELRDSLDYPITIIAGGSAFLGDKNKYKLVGADYFSGSYEDLKNILGNEVK